jgi:hypothetical protein
VLQTEIDLAGAQTAKHAHMGLIKIESQWGRAWSGRITVRVFEDASGRKLHAVPALEVSAAFWPFSKLVRWANTMYSDRGALRSRRS